MKLSKLKLANFRNYSSVDLIFNDGMNIFIGDNAQGKTNILESIEILALTKSHRVNANNNIIKQGEKNCLIKGVVANNYYISVLEYRAHDDNNKKLLINKKEIRKVADYISNLNVIIFTPDDLEIIKDSPLVRRNLLNVEISQVSKEYLITYNEYSKLLRTRNEYLKKLINNPNPNYTYLDIITDKLIEKSVLIYRKRYEFIKSINDNIGTFFYDISGFGNLRIEYIPNVSFSSFDFNTIHNVMKEVFNKNRTREINCGMTLYGPHRDDFLFLLNENDLKSYGSQGQQKLAILSFKLAEISIFNSIKKSKPILLFDDIFGELDIERQNKLLKILNTEEIQSIITTTSIGSINKKFYSTAYIYEVKNGIIERR